MMRPGRRRRWAARIRIRAMKKTPRAAETVMNGKSLGVLVVVLVLWAGLGLGCKKGDYHGMPRFNCVCTAMNQAKIPRQIEDADRTMRIQRLSWSSGQ